MADSSSALNVQDKEAVQTYKMEIKTHLLRLGLIRGQPRTSLSAGPSNQASSIVGTPGTGGTTTSRTGSERGSFSFPFDQPQQFEFSFPSGMASIPGKERFMNILVWIRLPGRDRQCSPPVSIGRFLSLLRYMGTGRVI
jgi:hypothetical protein